MESENVGNNARRFGIKIDRKLINNLVNDKDVDGKDLKWSEYLNSKTSWNAKIGGRDASKIQLEDGTIVKMTDDAKGNTVEIHENPDGTIFASIRNKSKRVTFKIKKGLNNSIPVTPYDTERNRKAAQRDRIRRGGEKLLNRWKNRVRNFLEGAKEDVTRAGAMAKGSEAIEKAAQSKNKTLKARLKNTQSKSMRKKPAEKNKPSKTKELLKKAGKLSGKFLKGILAFLMKMFKAYKQRKSAREELIDVISDLLKTSWKVTKGLSKAIFKGIFGDKSVKKNTTKSVGKANELSLGDKLKAAFQSLGKGINAPGVSKQKRGGLYEQVFGASSLVYGTGSLKNNTGGIQNVKLQLFLEVIRTLHKEKQKRQKTEKSQGTQKRKLPGTGVFWSAFPEMIKQQSQKGAMSTKRQQRPNSGPKRRMG